jgi:hypothetical protein
MSEEEGQARGRRGAGAWRCAVSAPAPLATPRAVWATDLRTVCRCAEAQGQEVPYRGCMGKAESRRRGRGRLPSMAAVGKQ